MTCVKSCGIAVMFFVAMAYMCVVSPLVLEESKYDVMRELKSKLTVEQQKKLYRIKKERTEIYLRGYGYGLILSALVLGWRMMSPSGKKSVTSTMMFCATAAITFTVNYFYYILSPKKEWMVTSLHSEEQKVAWLKVYRYMQINYHVGFVFGILAVAFMSKGISTGC